MDESTEAPLLTTEKARHFLLAQLEKVPTCVWGRLDSPLLGAILNALSMNTRGELSLEVSPLSIDVCVSMAMGVCPCQTNYLAYQLLISPSDIPGDHIVTIARFG